MGKSLVKTLKYSSWSAPFWNGLAYPVAGVLWARLKLIELTSRVHIAEAERPSGACVFVCWHQHIPFLVHVLGQKSSTMLVSSAPYMEPIAQWCIWSGLKLVRGASGENSKEAVELLKTHLRSGGSVSLAVDGPAGPIFKCKRGCTDLARELGVPIIPVGYQTRRGHPSRSRWDKSLFPTFFDTISVVFGPPIFIQAQDSDEMALSSVEAGLNALGTRR